MTSYNSFYNSVKLASDNQKIAQELEKQFNQSLENRFNRSHHVGLGFGASTAPKAEPKSEKAFGKHTTFDSDDDNKK